MTELGSVFIIVVLVQVLLIVVVGSIIFGFTYTMLKSYLPLLKSKIAAFSLSLITLGLIMNHFSFMIFTSTFMTLYSFSLFLVGLTISYKISTRK